VKERVFGLSQHWIPTAIAVVAAIATMGFSASKPQPFLYRQMRYVMGTLCEITIYDEDPKRAERAINQAFEEVQRVDRLLSNYDPNSELSRMNRTAASGPFLASVGLFGFMIQCHRFYRITEGAFDPTVGPLVRAWGFFGTDPRVPTASEVEAARAKVGMGKVELDEVHALISFPVEGMEIDPGGIGKGYAVDRAVRALRQSGIYSALVNAGGSSLYAIGSPPGRSYWRIGVKDPSAPDRPVAFVALRDNSLSTSGSLERHVRVGGQTFGHIFDPRSGAPVEGVLEVSVVAPTATESDALTKAAFVLSPPDAFRLFQKLGGIHALRFERRGSRGWRLRMTPWSESVFSLRGGVRGTHSVRRVDLNREN
jgi:FAD:protein FMN transferase